VAGADGGAFEEFVAAGSPRLLRAAYLLSGDWGRAEDLVQGALVKTWLHWSRLRDHQAAEAYARVVLMRMYTRSSRRRWFGETPAGDLPEPAAPDLHARYDDRDDVMRRLNSLPPRTRAAIVLRFFEDMTEQQIAAVLGCPAGTVKSLLSRGLAALRSPEGVAQ